MRHFLYLTIMFLGLLVAEAGLVVRRGWLRPLVAVSATGLLLVGLVLLRPPVWVDGLVTLGVFVGLWWTYRPAARGTVPGTAKYAYGEMR